MCCYDSKNGVANMSSYILFIVWLIAVFLISGMLMYLLSVRSLRKNPNKTDALLYALKNLYYVPPKLVQTLLQQGAKPNYAGEFGETPLVVALMERRNLSVIRELICGGADVNCCSNMKPFLAAMFRQCPLEVVQELIKSGVDVNDCLYGDGSSMLSIAAAFYPYPELIDILIAGGVDVNQQNYEGMTALSVAAYMGKFSRNLQKLVDCGANISLKDEKGKIAADYLQQNWRLRFRKKIRQLLTPQPELKN